MFATSVYGERFAARSAAAGSSAPSSTPRSRAPRGCGCSGTSSRACAPVGSRMSPRSFRRSTSATATRCGCSRATTSARPSMTPTPSTPPAAGSTARGGPRRRPRRRAGGQPVNLGDRGTDRVGGGMPVQLGGGLRDRECGRVGVRLGRRAGGARHRRASATPSCSATLADEHGERIVVGVDAARARSRSRAGSGRPTRPWAEAVEGSASRGVATLRLHAGRGRRDARGAGDRRPRARSSTPATGQRRVAHLLGRGGIAGGPGFPRGASGYRSLEAVIVGRAL